MQLELVKNYPAQHLFFIGKADSTDPKQFVGLHNFCRFFKGTSHTGRQICSWQPAWLPSSWDPCIFWQDSGEWGLQVALSLPLSMAPAVYSPWLGDTVSLEWLAAYVTNWKIHLGSLKIKLILAFCSIFPLLGQDGWGHTQSSSNSSWFGEGFFVIFY